MERYNILHAGVLGQVMVTGGLINEEQFDSSTLSPSLDKHSTLRVTGLSSNPQAFEQWNAGAIQLCVTKHKLISLYKDIIYARCIYCKRQFQDMGQLHQVWY